MNVKAKLTTAFNTVCFIIATKLASVSLCCKSHCFTTANIKILSTLTINIIISTIITGCAVAPALC